MKKSILFYLACVSLLTTCVKEEIGTRPYPRVRTYMVSNITIQGALFSGEIIFDPSGIIEHGFIWSLPKEMTLANAEMISLGSKTGAGKFEKLIEGSLTTGKYYVKAYAKTANYTVYGDLVEFESLGSKAPKVISINPVSATWRDTVTIAGENFSRFPENLKVTFDVEPATIISSTIDKVVCLVPQKLAQGPADISVSFKGNIGKLERTFQLKQPIISSISPTTGPVGTTVTLSGDFFSLTQSKIYFNSVQVQIVSVTQKQIIFKIPYITGEGKFPVRVETGSGNLRAETTFELKKPKIVNIAPLTGTYEDIITISGENFPTDPTVFSVKFGDITASVISVTENKIQAVVPISLAIPSHSISFNFGTEQIVHSQQFVLLPPEIFTVAPQKIFQGEKVTITGKNFSPEQNTVLVEGIPASVGFHSPNKLEFYYPNVSTHTPSILVTSSGQSDNYIGLVSPWALVGEIPFWQDGLQLSQFPNDDHFLIFNNNNLYEFIPTSNSWIQKSSLSLFSEPAFKFFINGSSYIGGGGSSDLLEYNYDTDSWRNKTSTPISAQYSGSITANGKAYVFGGVNSLESWGYDPPNDTWTRNSDLTEVITVNDVVSVLNNVFYFRPQSIIKMFEPITGQWTDLEIIDTDIGYCLFGVGGKLYFKTYSDNTFYSYNVQTKQWTQAGYHPSSIYEASPQIFNGSVYFMGFGNETGNFLMWEFIPGLL